MQAIILLLLLFSNHLFAKESLSAKPDNIFILRHFEEQNRIDIKTLPDLIEKEEKLELCIEQYIKNQSKSNTRQIQNNLYDLVYNFKGVVSGLVDNKKRQDNIPLKEKIEVLGRLQCELYFSMGILK